MRAPALFVAVACAAAAVLAVGTDGFVPLVMWSGRPYFVNDHVSVSDSVTAPEFRQMLERIVSPQQEATSDMKYLNTPVYFSTQHSAPEIVVAFVYEQMSSAAASRESGAYESASNAAAPNANFRFLRTAVDTAASSFAAPSFIPTDAVSKALTSLHSSIAPHAQVFATQIDGEAAEAKRSCDLLLQHLDDHAHVFANQQSELVLVKLGAELHRTDRCMQRVTEHIAQHTAGDYLAVLTADSASTHPLQTSFVESESHAHSHSHAQTLQGTNYARRFKTLATTSTTNSTTTYPGVTMINSSVFWGLIIALIMVIALSCGVCWVQSIETPPRFTSTQLALAKEY